MAHEQRTTEEQRAAVRQRYTPEPVPTCPACGHLRIRRWDGPPALQGRLFVCGSATCDAPREQTDCLANPGDPDVLAACDDAAALTGALERSAALERGVARQKELQLETNGVALEYLLRATRAEESLAGALAEVGRLRDALAFYADAHRYNYRPVGNGPWLEPSEVGQDRGKVARAALEPERP